MSVAGGESDGIKATICDGGYLTMPNEHLEHHTQQVFSTSGYEIPDPPQKDINIMTDLWDTNFYTDLIAE